jgi:hypothetical protein
LEGKIHFDENKDAAITFIPAISILLNASEGLEKGEKEKEVKTGLLSYLAPAAPICIGATLRLIPHMRDSNQLS